MQRGKEGFYILEKCGEHYVNAFQTASYKMLSLILQMGIHNHIMNINNFMHMRRRIMPKENKKG